MYEIIIILSKWNTCLFRTNYCRMGVEV